MFEMTQIALDKAVVYRLRSDTKFNAPYAMYDLLERK